ncbi:ParB/RepB/Spo0J family partition protein [Caenimonas koreensis DSM 17982]|uniref:ParB/RepB/Spo0J family partition protein n=1 Tax=Caenimonas koreensis DSM 17982 TaxID=1121255 RepID=A0A844AZC2_9BURK|nr:ParB/RepB/Spo0J family partition protein [Caenimonas koreensis]MRD49374.1 ParB/RepB/Spo0J family partition protein [Caenimonas koreensis DSM 17982]
MSMKDKLAARTKGLGAFPTTPVVKAADAGGSAAQRPRTGPGQMLAVRHLMGESAAETATLRAQLEAYADSVPSKMVDSATVGVSAYANRHEDEFSTPEFASLRDQIQNAGRNVQPIMVRGVKGRGSVQFEVMFGHRRLRACQDLGIPVWVVVVEASDQELFLAMDMENRERKNPSPFELGESYRRALHNELFPSLRALASRLHLDSGYVTRAYAIATLPPEVLDAFSSRTEIQFRWGKELSDKLQQDPEGVIKRALEIKAAGQKYGPSDVLARLLGHSESTPATELDIRPQGAKKAIAKIKQDKSGAVTVKVVPGVIATDKLDELHRILAKFLKA